MYRELLDVDIPPNLDLLDECVLKFYNDQPSSEEIKQIIGFFFERSDAFSIVDQVLQSNHSFELKVYALRIFSSFVTARWEAIHEENRIQLRNFIAQFINNIAAVPEESLPINKRQTLLRYADTVLINILKYDWPERWVSFIPDILQAAGSSPVMCANCFFILNSLAQEFTEFAEESLTTSKQAEMSATFISQFPCIIPLIEMALSSTENHDLVKEVLTSLKYFIKAIDPNIIFNNKIFNTISENLLPDPRYTIFCISVFGEIAANPCLDVDIASVVLPLFNSIVQCLCKIFQSDDMYKIQTKERPEEFVHMFTVSMTSFISSFQGLLENVSDSYSMMLRWLYNVTSQAGDVDFRLCIELWHTITRTLYTECISQRISYSPVYAPLLPLLRRLAINRMECPTEVILFVDDSGIHSRRREPSTQSTVAYTNMREMLVYLTHIDHQDMINSLFEKVEEIKTQPWSNDAMNSLCWAAGSLGGALTEEEEKHFVAQILEYLLTLCKSLPDVLMRANVASGIMYICSQYGRFLSKYWSLLKVVMYKLLEFMSESAPGVQDSAVESMKMVVSYCRNLLVSVQQGEDDSFLNWMLQNFSHVLQPLTFFNIVEMYEIYATMIQLVRNEEERAKMTTVISQDLNVRLSSLAADIQPGNSSWVEQLTFVINCNVKMATCLGPAFYVQLGAIIPTLVQVYNTIAAGSQVANELKEISVLQSIKGTIIKLFIKSVTVCGHISLIKSTVIPPAIQFFMPEYQSAKVKTPEILGLFAALITKVTSDMQASIQQLISSIYLPTLPFLEDFSENFQFWENFTLFIHSLIFYLPDFLIVFPNYEVARFVEFLKRCCQHPQPEVSEKALQALFDLLSALENRVPNQFQVDFANYFALDLTRFVMILMTDSVHKYAFNLLMGLSRKLIQMKVIQEKQLELFNIFVDLFPNRPPKELHSAIEHMLQFSTNYLEYKKLLRNFLVYVKKFAQKDPSLYAKEKEEIEKEIEEKKKIPGLLPPKESPEVQNNVENLVNIINSFNLQF